MDATAEAARVVRKLLTPLTTRVLEANNLDLPTYAEAAPDEFLSILEDDLRGEEPAILGLIRPTGAGVFEHPSRTGLLWALENLSWNPQTLPRAALILARLAQVEIDDNWANKPINSLEAIICSWMPQTCEPVREVMEDIQSEEMMRGAHTGIYNSRGVHWRGEGGDQERGLAEKYRKWGQALQVSHPFVSSRLLMRLARTYDSEASREDTEAGIRRRLAFH